MKNKKYGYWKSNGLEFYTKSEALLYATKNNTEVKFSYHDSVWNNFDKSLLGKVPLDLLYRERAIQLREKYTYLKLYYSGGPDSHNILMTYINNNIKLDEIIVRWPKVLIEKYKSNSRDRSAVNFWSEWDYSIKPVLEWLKQKHPEIKITILDYMPGLLHNSLETTMENSNNTRSGLIQGVSIFNPFEKDTIGYIFGVDKPLLYLKDGKIYMFFTDLALSVSYTNRPDDIQITNKECFYWAPDMPILACEMAYQFAQHFIRNPQERALLPGNGSVESEKMTMSEMIQTQNNIARQVCYTTWDNRFQADKPLSGLRRDKFAWFFTYPEFKRSKEIFLSGVKNMTQGIDDRFLSEETLKNGDVFHSIKVTPSDFFYICDLK